MSGPEWTIDEPGRRDDSPTLSPEAKPLDAPESGPESASGRKPPTVRIFTRSRAPNPEPAMAHAPSDRDESSEGPASPRPRKAWSLLVAVLSWLGKIRLPSLGSERHEMILDDPRPASTPTTPPVEAPADSPERAPARPSLLGLKTEARVGIAAVLSVVVLVTALLYNRGWLGGKSIPLALKTPTEGEPPTEPGDKPEIKPGEKAGDPGKGPGPATQVGQARTPAPANGDSAPPRLMLDGDPKGGEPKAPPSTGAESSRPTLLVGTSATTSPLTPPDAPQARPPVLPPGPTDPLQLPGDPPTTPPPSPEPTALPAMPRSPTPEPETNPGPSPMGDLPSIPSTTVIKDEPATSTTPSLPAVAEPAGPPTMGPPPSTDPTPPPPTMPPEPPPAPAPPLSPAPTRVEPTAPVRSERPLTLESVPAAASNPPPAPSPPAPATTSEAVEPVAATSSASTSAALGAGWVVIQSGGRRVVGAPTIVSSPAEGPTPPARVVDNPRVVDDPAVADQVEPVIHRVLPGENFWTIAKLYYGSGDRFYRALHAANERQVPDIRKLYVGTVLRIPPPEALDRSLIDPPSRAKADDPATSPLSRTSRRSEPPGEADLALPVRPRAARAEPEPTREPRRPTYTVKPFETLRSIARDTLNDPKRDREIYNLNREILDDPGDLPAGTTLTLPADATLGRRSR